MLVENAGRSGPLEESFVRMPELLRDLFCDERAYPERSGGIDRESATTDELLFVVKRFDKAILSVEHEQGDRVDQFVSVLRILRH